jgi:hypothetical protein
MNRPRFSGDSNGASFPSRHAYDLFMRLLDVSSERPVSALIIGATSVRVGGALSTLHLDCAPRAGDGASAAQGRDVSRNHLTRCAEFRCDLPLRESDASARLGTRFEQG